MFDYEVLVPGSGPGGLKAAVAAAELERRVAIVLSLVRRDRDRVRGIAGREVRAGV
ncbi:hypothetical protein [Sphaerisporangium dianthi]|uniref:FAD-binding protein n=1 Tax=Sphaerisporangium dianthi TaxID=1436120 RepID=A0ABV9CSG6_9ACTN